MVHNCTLNNCLDQLSVFICVNLSCRQVTDFMTNASKTCKEIQESERNMPGNICTLAAECVCECVRVTVCVTVLYVRLTVTVGCLCIFHTQLQAF